VQKCELQVHFSGADPGSWQSACKFVKTVPPARSDGEKGWSWHIAGYTTSLMDQQWHCGAMACVHTWSPALYCSSAKHSLQLSAEL